MSGFLIFLAVLILLRAFVSYLKCRNGIWRKKNKVLNKRKQFLKTVERWIDERGEVLVHYWHKYGCWHYRLYSDFEKAAAHFEAIVYPTQAVTIWKTYDFPIRGTVDEGFVKKAWLFFEEGRDDYLFMSMEEEGVYTPWATPYEAKDLKETLDEEVGNQAIFGREPDRNALDTIHFRPD